MPSNLDVQMMTLLSAPPDANLLPVINKRLLQHINSAINRHNFFKILIRVMSMLCLMLMATKPHSKSYYSTCDY